MKRVWRNLVRWLGKLGQDRGQYVYDAVPSPTDRILDIGCSYGWGLASLAGKARELYGVDVDESALCQAKAHYPHFTFLQQTGAELPFDSEMFDVVILSEVIEHVGDENKQPVVNEAHRVLKGGGLFILTAPYAGWLAWADPMDFKRRFSGLYRLYMRLSGYQPTTPIEVGHKHVSLAEIRTLFANRFVIEDIRYCSLLMPALTWIMAAGTRLHLMPSRMEERLNRLRAWESGVPMPRQLAFNIRLLARKKK